MTDSRATEILVLSDLDEELKRFFERVRAARRIVVQDGSDQFVVELRPLNISNEARRILARGGPVTGDS